MARPGDQCPCGHYIVVVNSFVRGENRTQYLGCRNCGWRPESNKVVKSVAITSFVEPTFSGNLQSTE